jgi:hypothetical protein
MESGWAELPEELLTKVLQAAEPCAPQDGGWVGGLLGDGAATSGWKCRHDALVMWLLLRQDACHRRGHRPLGGTRHMTVEYFSVLTSLHLPHRLATRFGAPAPPIAPPPGGPLFAASAGACLLKNDRMLRLPTVACLPSSARTRGAAARHCNTLINRGFRQVSIGIR